MNALNVQTFEVGLGDGIGEERTLFCVRIENSVPLPLALRL